jgi:hypothetical protein
MNQKHEHYIQKSKNCMQIKNVKEKLLLSSVAHHLLYDTGKDKSISTLTTGKIVSPRASGGSLTHRLSMSLGILIPLNLTLKMEAACSSKILISTNYHNPQDHKSELSPP